MCDHAPMLSACCVSATRQRHSADSQTACESLRRWRRTSSDGANLSQRLSRSGRSSNATVLLECWMLMRVLLLKQRWAGSW